MATSDPSARSSRAARSRRSPPETQARITSFTVASYTRPTSFTSSSGTERPAKRLRFETAPLNDVRGAAKKPGGDCSPATRQLAVVHAEVRHRLHTGLQRAQRRSRLPGQRRCGVAQHLRVGRQRCRVPLRRQLHNAGARRQVQEGRQHGRAAHPVEDGVVHLGHQCRALPLEPLDHVHLPERAVRVELAAHDPGHEGVELGLSSGRGQAGPAQVVVEVEVRIVDPDRVVQPEGHPEGALAQRGDQVQALLNDPADLRVAGRRREQRARALGRVEHQRHADVHRRGRRLQREEGGIHADE